MGMGEFLLIIGVTLILFKPAELPVLLRALGRILRKIRHLTATVTDYLERSVQEEEAQEYEKQARQQVKAKDGSKKKSPQ